MNLNIIKKNQKQIILFLIGVAVGYYLIPKLQTFVVGGQEDEGGQEAEGGLPFTLWGKEFDGLGVESCEDTGPCPYTECVRHFTCFDEKEELKNQLGTEGSHHPAALAFSNCLTERKNYIVDNGGDPNVDNAWFVPRECRAAWDAARGRDAASRDPRLVDVGAPQQHSTSALIGAIGTMSTGDGQSVENVTPPPAPPPSAARNRSAKIRSMSR